ncbi:NAD(P)H-dependent oxidoreductase [Fertoebacter nigrum]|uniref:NAD(P)H-dependent oxidoreductase n=1 Tax=Fertoeibacter niger TaxID=2656921 RepID=A0A8X8H2N0_9RHOB|nr:NADPH-dependent FMN reductase [Fertoeibacter niger]NUB46468.1 NAD(P)H-dependent oxidoreductase [Fertoeibacter niger]
MVDAFGLEARQRVVEDFVRSQPKLVAIPGSIRTYSANLAVLRTLADHCSARVSVDIFGLHHIPPYNADLDTDTPPGAVESLRAAIEQSDGLIICSPEYNYGIPGVLKNALDWASRPAYNSSLKGKPALIMTASTGQFGGARAQSPIRECLSATLCRVVIRPQIAIPRIDKKIAGGRLTDPFTLSQIDEAIEDLIKEVKLGKGAAP